MEEIPPPTEHTLRPHHLVLLSILMIAFKDLEIKSFPPEFATHLLRVTEPLSHRELMRRIGDPRWTSTSREVSRFMAALNTVHGETYSVEKLGNFLGNLPSLFMEKVHEDKPRLLRRSIFGYFCRRCFITYMKLSFSQLSKLREDYVAWCQGRNVPYETIPKDDLTNQHLIHKTQSDKKSYATPDAYAAWEKARANGDESVAIESVRRFFEQHFHDQSDSGYRQHALLNVVHMHYFNQEYVAARKLLHEAIGVARTANDRPTLQHCLSLLRRLPQPPGGKPFINEIQPDMHPLEILFDVKKMLDEENEQPISQAFDKVVEAVALYDHWLDTQSAVPNDNHQWSQHAVQAIVWREAGCDTLARTSEEVVCTFTEPGTDNSTRLHVLLSRTYDMARQGNYSAALEILFSHHTWRGLTMADYNVWAHGVWNILALRAIRRGQSRLYNEYLLPRKPSGEWSSKYYTYEPQGNPLSPIRQSLHEVLRLKNCEQMHNAVDSLLRALWQSEFLGRYHAYRSAILLLADFGLQYGMPQRSKRLVEEIMPQVVGDSCDRELRAVAAFTMARCILAADGRSPPVVKNALYFLNCAQGDFKSLEMYKSMEDVTYFKAVLFNSLGDVPNVEHETRLIQELEVLRKSMEARTEDADIEQMYDTVLTIGACLSGR